MSFSWLAIWQGLPYLLQGAGLTIIISATAMLLALILGMAVALVSQIPWWAARGLVRAGGLVLGLIALVRAPLVLAGQLPGLLQSYDGSVGRFPRTTVAAYNLWFLVLNGGSSRDTEFLVGAI